MRKTTLIVFGNIASGKTSVCRYLVQQLPDHRHVCLDDHRKKIWMAHPGMGAGQRDLMAQNKCLDDIYGLVIFETTGVTRFFARAKRKLDGDGGRLILVHLDCAPDVCIRRYNARLSKGHIQAPFAWGNYTIEESIYYLHDRQLELNPTIRINTTKVHPEHAAKFISEWLRKNGSLE